MELTIQQALQQGVAAHKKGQVEEAERLYKAILNSQPAQPDANHNLGVLLVSINKTDADSAFDAATCIGCGACVATCKNSSAMLFVGAKVSQYALLPQGKVEASDRVVKMIDQMDLEGFGNCSNTGACEVECPKGISLDNIARMNRELMKYKVL